MVEREDARGRSDGCGLEARLYALWERCATTGARTTTLDGRDVIVLSRGVRNDGPGPDYLGAVLVVAGKLHVGAVEMHREESDWFVHGHDRDPAYEAVVLHVLGVAPRRQALAVPTVVASALESASSEGTRPGLVSSGTRSQHSGTPSGPPEISASLLAEAAWARLLRRVTEITRAERAQSLEARLRSAFVLRLFDCLGYSANRSAMRTLAARIVDDGDLDLSGAPAGFDAFAARLFGLAGSDERTVRALGAGFMSDARLDRILRARPGPIPGLRWTHATRPANAPERRLWAAARLLAEITSARRLERLLERLAAGAPWHRLELELVVRLGSESFIGRSRAAEIVMNALVPVALAAGVERGSVTLIERACRLYRNAPAQQSNRTIRQVERRYLGGRVLTGGFWQQGAIEHFQRYLSPDRSGLRFLSETRRIYRRSPGTDDIQF